MDALRHLTLIAATVTTGLTAGLLFAYACSVMPALAGADDRTFVDVMRRVNVAILNGWFLICFIGALLFGLLAGLLHLGAPTRPVLAWIIAGVALYLVALAVTGAVNVPLNNALAAAGAPLASDPQALDPQAGDPQALGGSGPAADLAVIRAGFERRWVTWNIVRTVAATASFACLTSALVVSGTATATG